MKLPIAIILCLSLLSSCEYFNPRKLKGFKKVEINGAHKLVKISSVYLTSDESSDESSDEWADYYITIYDCESGNAEKTIEYTVDDGRNDKGQILQITANHVFLLNDTYTVVELSTEKIYRGQEVQELIERNNPEIQNKTGNLNSYSQNFLSLTTKQGESFAVSLKTFKIYPANPNKYWEIPDSLLFYNIYGTTRISAYIPHNVNLFLWGAFDTLAYSLENDELNPAQSFIYQYNVHKIKLQSQTFDEFTSFTVLDSSVYDLQADPLSRKKISDNVFINGYLNNLHDGILFIKHNNEVSEKPKEMFSAFDITKSELLYSIELPQLEFNVPNQYGEIYWSEDKTTFFYCSLNTSNPIFEFDAKTGKQLISYKD